QGGEHRHELGPHRGAQQPGHGAPGGDQPHHHQAVQQPVPICEDRPERGGAQQGGARGDQPQPVPGRAAAGPLPGHGRGAGPQPPPPAAGGLAAHRTPPATVSASAARQAKPCEPRPTSGHSASSFVPWVTLTTRQPDSSSAALEARCSRSARCRASSGRLSQVELSIRNITQVAPLPRSPESTSASPASSVPNTPNTSPPSE